MTEQNIEQLARHRKVPSWVLKLVADAIAHEREACAKVCDAIRYEGYVPPEDGAAADYYNDASIECAAAIRARGNL